MDEVTAVHVSKAAPWALKAFAAAAFFAVTPLPSHAAEPQPACDCPMDLVKFAQPLPRVAGKLMAGTPITIVAIGSSSTAGAGASTPEGSYPSRLAVELKQTFPKQEFKVINRGVNGEEVEEMLKRFDTSVIAEKPDLVLWQLGTNSLLRDNMLSDQGAMIRGGLDKLRAIGADIVLIDPQFAPKVIAKPHAEQMVEFIAVTARKENVELFRRYQVMKRWSEVNRLPFETFVSADGLHLNDWSYACMAKGLGMAIAEAAQRPVLSATAVPMRPTP